MRNQGLFGKLEVCRKALAGLLPAEGKGELPLLTSGERKRQVEVLRRVVRRLDEMEIEVQGMTR